MRKDDARLLDILLACNDVQEFVAGASREEFMSDGQLQSALCMKLEIIGEALNRIKKLDEKILNDITSAHRIIGFRNVIIHGYDVLDSKIIWDALQYNLPKLKEDIINLMKI